MTSADAILIDYEVTLQGLAWVSERKGLPKSQDDTEGDFIASKEWQAYLKLHRPDDMSFILVVRDCQRLTFRSSGKEHVRISISVPADAVKAWLEDRFKEAGGANKPNVLAKPAPGN